MFKKPFVLNDIWPNAFVLRRHLFKKPFVLSHIWPKSYLFKIRPFLIVPSPELINSQHVHVSFPSTLTIFLLLYICVFSVYLYIYGALFYVFVHSYFLISIWQQPNLSQSIRVTVLPLQCYHYSVTVTVILLQCNASPLITSWQPDSQWDSVDHTGRWEVNWGRF